MTSIKCLSVLLLACLFYNAANAKPDAESYTVTFKYGNVVSWCLGAIIGEDLAITSIECFATWNGDFINYTSLTAHIGSVEVDVQSVTIFDFPLPENESTPVEKLYHDFALVKFKQSLNLKKNGFIALSLPEADEEVDEYEVLFATSRDDNEAQKVLLTDESDCPNVDFIQFDPDSQLCVELINFEGISSYQQTGSPLVDKDNRVIGIFIDNYSETPYEVYTKVSYFIDVMNAALAGEPGDYKVHNYL